MGGSGSKKKSSNEEANGKQAVTERKHPYEECNPNGDDDDKPDPGKECKVERKPRQYEEIDTDFEKENAAAKESNNSRLSQKQSGDLNYVDVEFDSKPKKKKKSKKDKDTSESSDVPEPSVEYSEVIVQNSKPTLK